MSADDLALTEASDVRELMRQWATGVAVVTSSHVPDGGDERTLTGCTVNSVTSVSLDPPLVLVCLGESSRTLKLIRRAGRFGLSFLTTEQIALARVFASSAREDEKFAGVDTLWIDDVPLLPGVLAHAICETESVRVAGDHSLVLGKLRHAATAGIEAPLLSYGGGFRLLDEQPAATATAAR